MFSKPIQDIFIQLGWKPDEIQSVRQHVVRYYVSGNIIGTLDMETGTLAITPELGKKVKYYRLIPVEMESRPRVVDWCATCGLQRGACSCKP